MRADGQARADGGMEADGGAHGSGRVAETVWIAVVSAAVLLGVWGAAAFAVAGGLVVELGGAPTAVGALVIAAGALSLAAQAVVTYHLGPRRASPARLLITGGPEHPRRQIVVAVGAAAAVAALVGCVMVGFAAHLGAVTPVVLGALAVGCAGAVALPLLAAFVQRGGQELVPRWRLIAADARTSALTMSVASLNADAMHATGELGRTARPRRPLTPPGGPGVRLMILTCVRASQARLLLMLAVAATGPLVVLLGSVRLALVAMVCAAVVAAASWARPVMDAAGSAHLRRLLGGARGTAALPVAVAAVCAGLLPLLVGLVATVGLAAWLFPGGGGPWEPMVSEQCPLQLAAWVAVLGAAHVCGVLGRAAGVLAAQRTGVRVMTTNEFGPVPLDVLQRLSAGWVGPVIAAVLLVQGFAALALAVAIGAALYSAWAWRSEVMEQDRVRELAVQDGAVQGAVRDWE